MTEFVRFITTEMGELKTDTGADQLHSKADLPICYRMYAKRLFTHNLGKRTYRFILSSND